MPGISKDRKVVVDLGEAIAVYIRDYVFDGDWDKQIAWTIAYAPPERAEDEPSWFEELRQFEIEMGVNLNEALKEIGWELPVSRGMRARFWQLPSRWKADPDRYRADRPLADAVADALREAVRELENLTLPPPYRYQRTARRRPRPNT
jgi:hypothetical protein